MHWALIPGGIHPCLRPVYVTGRWGAPPWVWASLWGSPRSLDCRPGPGQLSPDSLHHRLKSPFCFPGFPPPCMTLEQSVGGHENLGSAEEPWAWVGKAQPPPSGRPSLTFALILAPPGCLVGYVCLCVCRAPDTFAGNVGQLPPTCRSLERTRGQDSPWRSEGTRLLVGHAPTHTPTHAPTPSPTPHLARVQRFPIFPGPLVPQCCCPLLLSVNPWRAPQAT